MMQRQQLKLKGKATTEAAGELKSEKEPKTKDSTDKPVKELKTGQKAKKKVKIKPRSKKMEKTVRDLKIAYGPFLEKNPICAIQSPECTFKATAVHHTRGRGVKEVLDQSTWLPCCSACNGYVEANDAWAREHGFKKSRHQKNETK